MGSLFSLFMLPGVSSIGASGGILGLLGFMTLLGLRRRALLPPGFGKSLVRSIAGLVVLGLAAWKVVDNAAHAGGYISGCILGFLFFRASQGPLPLPETRGLKVLDAISGAVILGAAVITTTRLLAH
jgi:membrane associated rhomboid family serine protease